MAMQSVQHMMQFLRSMGQPKPRVLSFPELFDHFKRLISANNRSLEIMADLGEKLSGEFVFDQNFITTQVEELNERVHRMIYHLDCMSPNTFRSLFPVYDRIRSEVESELRGNLVIPDGEYVIGYDTIDSTVKTLVGGKNANLATAGSVLDLKIPDGFAISSRCFDILLRTGRPAEKIADILDSWQAKDLGTREASRRLQGLIKGLSLPREIQKAIEQGVSSVTSRYSHDTPLSFAVRSSGIGEDSEHSFAGQYKSLLNVAAQDVPWAYREVLASLYSTRAMEYRRLKGIKESEVVMAVGCQTMIPTKVSGVIYTLDVFNTQENRILISALPGLGADLVGGQQQADRFMVSRLPPYAVTGMEIVHKEHQLVPESDGKGLKVVPLASDLCDYPSLKVEQIGEITEAALGLENYFKHPQDIEFVIDENDQLVILQTRPLNIDHSKPRMVCDLSSIEKHSPILMEGCGEIVQEGVAMGMVHTVRSESDLDSVDTGAILVAHFSSPHLARVIKKVNGIITDIGSPIGHLSTICREFRIPMLINTGTATEILKDGQKITLDAVDNRVFEGYNTDLCYYEFVREQIQDTYEYRLLRRMFRKISPLRLVDPSTDSFTPESCRTLHDLIRFVHEQSVNVLVEKNYITDATLRKYSRKLKLCIPLDLTVIDFDLCYLDAKSGVTVDQLRCPPLIEFVQGMCAPGVWARDPVNVDFRSFMSSMTRTFATNVADPRFVGRNLAVSSGDYVNISLRLGYHYSMIDTIASEKDTENYIYFRFFGGVTDKTRRSRRAQLIQQILSANHFMTSGKGDLVIGRIKGVSRDNILEKVTMLGVLVSFTRQLDIKMVNDDTIPQFVSEFQRVLSFLDHSTHQGDPP